MFFVTRMSEDGVGVKAYFLEVMRLLYHFVVIGKNMKVVMKRTGDGIEVSYKYILVHDNA